MDGGRKGTDGINNERTTGRHRHVESNDKSSDLGINLLCLRLSRKATGEVVHSTTAQREQERGESTRSSTFRSDGQQESKDESHQGTTGQQMVSARPSESRRDGARARAASKRFHCAPCKEGLVWAGRLVTVGFRATCCFRACTHEPLAGAALPAAFCSHRIHRVRTMEKKNGEGNPRFEISGIRQGAGAVAQGCPATT